jgi:uncharacterized coiled-coil DUF342 family protein
MLIDDTQKLDALRDELKHLIREETSTTRWNRRRDEFLKELPSLLAAMKPLGSISATEADKLRKDRDRYQQESVALDERVERLQEQVAALSMSGSSALVAVNALMLKRLRLKAPAAAIVPTKS